MKSYVTLRDNKGEKEKWTAAQTPTKKEQAENFAP
jgi:hypothetical protein